MAFAMAITSRVDGGYGAEAFVYGTYTSTGGSTGGEVVTGLLSCKGLHLQPKGSAVISTQSVVNETFPVNGGSITIVTSADEVGQWFANGY